MKSSYSGNVSPLPASRRETLKRVSHWLSAFSGTGFARCSYILFGFVAVVAALSSAGGWAYGQSTSDVSTLLPAQVTALGSLDCPWLWSNTAQIRQTPQVASTIQRFEESSGLSIQSNITPWLGRLVVADIAPTGEKPKIVVLAEIRDTAAFANCLFQLRGSPNGKSTIQEQTMTILGHSVTKIFSTSYPTQSAYITVEKNWLVVGIGDGTLDRVIGVWNGSVPNLTADVGFRKVLAKLPVSSAPIWAVGDPRKSMAGYIPDLNKYSSADADGVIGAVLLDKGNTLEMRMVAYVLNPSTQALYRQMFAGTKPVTGVSLATVPNSASMVYMMSSPGYWIDVVAQQYRRFVPKTRASQMQPMVSMLQMYRPIYEPLTGEMALSGIYRGGSGGILLSAGTASSAAANGVASSIAQALSPMIPSLQRTGNQWSIAPPRAVTTSMFSPAMRINRNYLQIASSASWLYAPAGNSGFKIPTDAAGATWVILLRFKYVGELLKMISPGSPTSDQGSIAAILKRNSLQNATFAAWQTMDPSGQFDTGVSRLSNLDWKTTLSQLAVAAISMSPAPTPPPAAGANPPVAVPPSAAPPAMSAPVAPPAAAPMAPATPAPTGPVL